MRVQLTETVLRDANQSLIATRLPYSVYEPILSTMDKAGYYSIECWGGATFDTCLRYLDEDPWERLRGLRKHLPNARLQMLLRGQNLLGYKHYPDAVVEKFVELSIKNGIDIIRIFDALNDFRNIQTALEATKKYATEKTVASGCISYTQSPVHTVEKYVEMCKELQRMGFDTICLKDMAGTMSPFEAEGLIKGIKDAVGDMPVILHTHCTTGMAYMTYMKAIDAGIDVIDTATSCFSGGTSQPATETMFYALQQMGIETGIDEKVIKKVNDFFKPIKEGYVKDGTLNPKSLSTDSQALVYKVPGGMLSNMIANLTDLHAMDKFDDALVEIPKVRADLGYPPLVTPMSQMVGTQAVMNCIAGRYKAVSKEVKAYFRGEYGNPPAPVNAELAKQILGNEEPIDCRVADAAPSTMFEDTRAKLGDLAQSDEDVMSYICFPDQAEAFLKKRKAKAEGTWVEPEAAQSGDAAPKAETLGTPGAMPAGAPQVNGNAVTYTVSCESV